MDVSGIRLVLAAARDSRDDGWAFALTRGSPAVRRVFELVRLDEHLPYQDGR
jgi:anti-anti-sigma regulatory factor